MTQAERDILERILERVDLLPELAAQVAANRESARSAHHRIDALDSVGQARCQERREVCEEMRRARSSVQVATIQAGATVRSRVIVAVVAAIATIAGAVGAVIAGMIGR